METLWNKDVGMPPEVTRFTVGSDPLWDLRLAPYDIKGSMAHVSMLGKIGILTPQEKEKLLEGLDVILEKVRQGGLVIGQGAEDIHSLIELELSRKLGDLGKKIHAGRSRNDQVLTDIHLYLKDVCKEIARQTGNLFRCLQEKSELYKDILMPGYTHERPAMPSSFGLWFGAYAETLVDDIYQLTAAWQQCDQNPLGSAAGYGNSFPLDREETTRLLGFGTLKFNSIAAQMSRGRTERSLSFAMASLAGTLNKLAADCCLFSGPDYGFMDFPESLTTGSSIMPHKKNPDVWELIRARCNSIQGLPNQIALVCTNLTHGYHRDYQLLKDLLFPAIDSLFDCINMSVLMVDNMKVKNKILENTRYDQLFSVETANRLVLNGIPFRDAYRQVAMSLKDGSYKAEKNIRHIHTGSIGDPANEKIREKMEQALSRILLKD
ncbi:MAG: argininosuccinate lyase [Bacteroidales bacterium]|nr:argininosuccinate lyase [Bacteroidales bacterium]MDD4167135.1 argininosuccinate lyase [Bacteroidales bacterium]MDD4472697.1 argininosuccinate lyase [Bacteroidales bacterium]MDD5046285.1 argininosuccinate lyase [Bacteroidales bacterium]